jgi:hypothetical protein
VVKLGEKVAQEWRWKLGDRFVSFVLKAIYSTQPSTTVMCMGVGLPIVSLPVSHLLRYEIDMKWATVFRYLAGCHSYALDKDKVVAVTARRVKIDGVIANARRKVFW